jgi:hypothetical protein
MTVFVFALLGVVIVLAVVTGITHGWLRNDLIKVGAEASEALRLVKLDSDIAFKKATAATDSLALTQKSLGEHYRETLAHRDTLQTWWASVEERLLAQRNQLAAFGEEQQKLCSLVSELLTRVTCGEIGRKSLARNMIEVQQGMAKFRDELKACANVLGETTRLIEPAYPALTKARRRWLDEARDRELAYVSAVGQRVDQAFNSPEGRNYMAQQISDAPLAPGEQFATLPDVAFTEWVKGHEALRLLAGGEAEVPRVARAALNLGIQVLMTAAEEDARANSGEKMFGQAGATLRGEPYQVPEGGEPQAAAGSEFEAV